MSISTATFTLSDEQIFKLAKNAILSYAPETYQVLKMTKWVTEDFMNYREGINSYISANIRVVNLYGKKLTLKVSIQPKMGENGNYINEPNRICCYTNGLWLDKKYDEVKDLSLENVEFEDDFETAIIKRDEATLAYKRKETLNKLKGDLDWNIKQFRSYKASKRTYAKYDMEELRDFMSDLNEKQQEYLTGVIEAINEKEEAKTVQQYLSELTGAKREIFAQLEESFKENESAVLENVIKWLANEYKDSTYMTDDRIKVEALQYVEIQKLKLFYSAGKHLNNLDINSVEKESFNAHGNGFEGSWLIKLVDGSEKVFETRTIIAGGYIQRMHYRYLSKLS
jgi:hypothetical protein